MLAFALYLKMKKQHCSLPVVLLVALSMVSYATAA
jgi:hypothetical protein